MPQSDESGVHGLFAVAARASRCVDCHVGAGDVVREIEAVGVDQVYSAAFNKYPRPIPTPVENWRPAAETCEQCHWPKKFIGDQFKQITISQATSTTRAARSTC